MSSISVVIIVKDAIILDYSPVQTILSSLEIPSVNKVFVNEGMSNDGTYELISSIKDDRLEIIRRDWRMDKSFWAEERNYLINLAKNYSDYLLILDADEFLFKEDVGIIEDFVKNPNGFYGMKFKYLHYFRVFDGNSKDCLRINKNPAWYQEHAKLVHFSLNPRLEIVGHNADDFVGTFKGRKTFLHSCGALTNSSVRVGHFGYARDAKAAGMKFKRNDEIYQNSTEYVSGSLPNPVNFSYPAYSGPHDKFLINPVFPDVKYVSDWIEAKHRRCSYESD